MNWIYRCFAGFFVLGANLLPRHAQATLPRAVVVVSDLHFGEGKQGDGWSPIEDFRWTDDFKGLLDTLQAHWPSGVDLVLNGDTFELWQSSSVTCGKSGDPDLGCSEDQADARLKRVLEQHAQSIADLNGFAKEKNHVWIVPGNHDAALLMQKVGDRLRSAFTSRNVHLQTSGAFVSEDGLVVAEHGHMIGEDPNNLKDWPRPYRKVGQDMFMNSPWGEQFVKQYYDAWERKYPILDNITEELAGAGYAMKREGVANSLMATKDFLRFYVLGVSWAQLGGTLGEKKYEGNAPPDWDTSKIDQATLAALLPATDPVRGLLLNGQVTFLPQSLGDEQLRLLCDRALAERKGRPGKDFPCSLKNGTLGLFGEGFLRRRKDVIFDHIQKLRAKLAPGMVTYVFSHTHRAEMPYLARMKGPFQPKVVNTGAWQRIVTPEQIAKRFSPPESVLDNLTLEQLPRCYSFVAIEPGGEKEPQLLRYPLPAADPWKTVETNLCENSAW
jgi:UDP-2,3-diacylglucosamine pyrophosphatase LpxH